MPLLKADTKENLKSTLKDSVLILVYEFIGTTLLCALITNYYNQIQYDKDSVRDNVGLLLGMFVIILFSARISGSHYNPCITASYMVGNVRHGNFNRYLGFLYIAAQMAGGLLGAAFGKIFAGSQEVALDLTIDSSDFLQQVVLEMMGSFFLVFMYLSSTDPKTKFTKDAAIQTIILSGAYLGAMLLAGSKLKILKASPVNPAIAIGVFFFNGFDSKNFKTLIIFVTAPLAGSFLALLFFRFIYQKTTEQIEMEDEDDNSSQMMDGDNLGRGLLDQ